jgi:hypothetical protein
LHEFTAQSDHEDTTSEQPEQWQIENTNFEAMNDIIRRVRDEHEAGLEERRTNKRRKRDGVEGMVIYI